MHAAIVGAGTMGGFHARAWSQQPGVKVSAVVDASPEAAQTLAEAYGADAFPSLEASVKANRIDIVSICTPPSFHREQVMISARAGAHMLLEKPAGINLADYDAMQQALDESGVHLLVGVTHRFYPETRVAKRWIEEGKIGTPISILEQLRLDPARLPDWYFDPAVSGGGVLLTNGIHILDKHLWLTGAEEVQIQRATLRNLSARGEVEDFAEVDLQLDGHTSAHIHLLWMPGVTTRPRLDIVGTRGVLQIIPWERLTYLGQDGVMEETFYTTETDETDSIEQTLVGITAEAQTLLATIQGKQPPTSTLRQNRRIFELIREIYQRAGV